MSVRNSPIGPIYVCKACDDFWTAATVERVAYLGEKHDPHKPKRRAPRVADPEHGTVARYSRATIRCRCDLCKKAMSDYNREHAARSKYK